MSQFTYTPKNLVTTAPIQHFESDVQFRATRGIWGSGRSRINPTDVVATEKGTFAKYPTLTVEIYVLCHAFPFALMADQTPAHKFNYSRQFRLMNDDGTWNDSELNAYYTASQSCLALGQRIQSLSDRCKGSWSNEDAAAVLDAVTDWINAHQFRLSARQEDYTPKGVSPARSNSRTTKTGGHPLPSGTAPISSFLPAEDSSDVPFA